MDLRNEFRQGLLKTRNWKSIIDALQASIDAVEDDETKSNLYFDLGRLSEEEFLRRDLAMEFYQTAFKLNADRVDALERARNIYWARGELEMVAKLLNLELHRCEDDDKRVALHHHLGLTYLDMKELEQGLDTLRLAASAKPDDALVAEDLAAAEFDPDAWESDVASLLEGVGDLDTDAACRRLVRAARIVLQEADDSPRLEELLRNALEYSVQDPEANFLMERLLLAADRLDDLQKVQQQRVYAAADELAQAELYRQFADFWEIRAQDSERSAALYRRALQAAYEEGHGFPGHFVAAERVMGAYADKGVWEELFGLIDLGLQTNIPDEEKVALASLAGAVGVDFLEDRERSAQYFAHLEQTAPEHEDFLRCVLGQEPAADASPAEEPAAEEPEAEEPAAEEPAAEAAAPEPEPEPEVEEAFEETFEGKALEFIEQAEAMEAEQPEKAVDSWRRAAQAAPRGVKPRIQLGYCLKQVEKWNAAADAFNDALRKMPDGFPHKRASILKELLFLYREKMNLDVKVLDALKQLVQLEPKNLEYIDQLIDQLGKMKRLPDLVSALQAKADAVDDPAHKIEIQLDIARTFIEKFSNQAEAIKAFEKVLDLDPANLEAIGHLKGMYEKRRDWEKLIKVSKVEIEQAEDPDEKTVRMIDLARLATEKLKRPAVSAELWKAVVEVDDHNVEALGQLEKLYEREKNWEALGEVCEKQLELIEDDQQRGQLAQKLGVLYSDKLKDPDKAIGAWKQLLAIEPTNRRAQDSLKKMYLAAKAWQELEDFYAAQDKWDEFIRVLERQVDQEDDETKIKLLFKVATLWQEQIGKPERAVRAYEAVLDVDGQNLEAAEALIPLFTAANNFKKVVGVLEIQLGHTEDPVERLERVRALAGIYEENLRDKNTALARYLAAFDQAPEEEWLREEIERLAEETGEWGQVVEAYEAATQKFEDPTAALPLMLVVARVHEEKLVDLDSALTVNKRILDLDDVNEQAIGALLRLYEAMQEWPALLEIYEKKVDLAGSDDERRDIHFQIARLYEEQIGEPDKAIQAYCAMLEISGEDLGALEALDKLYTSQEKWSELAETIGRELALVMDGEPTQVADLKFRLGNIAEVHLDDLRTAIDNYRDILELDRSHEPAREALERHLDNEEYKLEVSRLLEPIYEALTDHERQVEIYEIQLQGEEDTFAKVDLLLRVGEIQATRLGDFPKAFDAFSRCFRLDPANEVARRELFRLAEVEENFQDLVGLYESVVAGDLDPSLQRELFVDIAEVYDTRLDGWDKAVEFFRRALDIEPEDPNTLDALEKLYTRREQWADLLEIYRRKVDMTGEPEERENLYFQIAYLQEEMLNQLEEAIATYREIVAADDMNLRAYKALDRLLFQQENWHDLADNLSRQLELTLDDPTEQLELRLRVAELREAKLEQTAAAVDTYREVLELDPDNDPATAALERLLQVEEHQEVVATILEPIYRARDDWQNLVRVLEIMVKHSFDPTQKIETLHQIGELYEVAGDDSRSAFQTYGRALEEDPSNEETQTWIERLCRELDNWEDLVQLLSTRVQDTTDEELAVMLHTRIAQILELQVGDLERAAGSYYKVLEVDPGRMEAADSLERIFIQMDDSARLVQVVLRKADIVMDPDEKKDLFFRSAQIQEEVLDDQEAAIAVYNQVLDLDENDLHALDNLEKLYIRLERWENLKDVYAKKAELAETDEDRKQMLYVLGQVYDTELKDVERAIDTYQGILEIDHEDYQAIQALDRLYYQAERWYDLLSILEREVELAGGALAEVVGLKHRIGGLWEHQLGDLVRAVESYREALEMDHDHQPTVQALDAIVHGDKEPVLAAQVLEPIYEAAMEWERLIDLAEVMVVHAEDPYAKVELLQRIAMLYETQLDRANDAFNAYARAFKEDAANEEVIAHLERLAEYTGLWEELAKRYEEQLEKTLDGDLQIQLLLRVARVWEEELAQVDQAVTRYQRVLDHDPENRNAIYALDRLFVTGERWQELTEVLRREIRMAESDDDMVDLQFRLGQTFETNLKDMENAIECYREILATRPDHDSTVQALELLFTEEVKQQEIATILEPLYQMNEQYQKLGRILEVQLGYIEDPHDRLAHIQRIAELHEHNLVDQVEAFRWWGRAFAEEPLSEIAGDEVERLAEETGAWEELVNVYLQVVEAKAEEPDLVKAVLLRVARIYETEIGDLQRSEEAHLHVLNIDEHASEALEALDRIYSQLGAFEQLAAILARRIGVADETDLVIELQFRLARVHQDALDDLDSAVTAFQAVLDNDSHNAEALEGLERIYFRREQWPELYSVYERMVDIASGDSELSDCYSRMAKIASDALDDPEKAMDLWNRVLDIRGEDAMALWAMADLFQAAERWDDLVDVLERQVSISEEAEAQIAIYERLGRIWSEKLHKDRNAIDAWHNILGIDPSNLTALWALSDLYRESQAWEELVDTLHRLIEIGITQMEEPELKGLYAQLGELQGDILMRPMEAIEAWQKVMTLDEADFKAMAALEILYTQEAMWEDCISVLERKVRALEDPEEQIEVLMQAANIWEDKVGQADQAAAVYERILEATPGNMNASNNLEHIYRDMFNWEKLAGLLMERVEHLEGTEEQVETLQSVARLYEEQLSNPDGAFEVLEVAFSLDYTNEVTAQEFERLASTTGKWNELLQDYSTVVQNIDDVEIKCDLWVKIGRWYGEKLERPDYAIASLQQALQLNNEHKPALSALADFYRMQQQWPELAAVISRHAELEEEPEELVKLHLALAELYEDMLQNPSQAIQSYQAALLAEEGNMDALSSLERLYRMYQQWEPLIDILKQRAIHTDDMDEVISLKMQVGELFEDRLDDAYKAIDSYKEIIEVDPQHLDALRALEKLYEKTGQMEEYLDVLEQQLDIIGADDERISKYQQMAAVWEEHFDKIERASECYEKILLIDERNIGAYRNLERLYRQERKWEELVDSYGRHINAVYEDSDRIDIYQLMGEIYEKELSDPDRAVESYNDILTFDPDHAGALTSLGTLYETIEDWDRALDVLQRLSQIVSDAMEKVEIYHRLGRINQEYLGDVEAAEERYVQAMELDPAYLPTMNALTTIYQNRGDWMKAAKMMVQAEASTQNLLEKTRLLHEAGIIYLEKLEDQDTARELLSRTVELDPEHVEAAEPLAELYFAEQRYQELDPILDMLVRKSEGKDNKSLSILFYMAAYTAEQLGEPDKAIKYYRQAYDADSTHLPTLKGMANLLYSQQQWDKSFKIFQTILVHHRDAQSDEEITDIFYRLGNIKRELGDRKKALNMYEKALEVDRGHRATLEAVMELEGKLNNWEAVIHAKRALIDYAETDDARFDALQDVGDIYHEKLNNTQKALTAYGEALEIKPQDHVVLSKSLELYTESKQWKKAVDVLLQFVEMETDPKRRSKYYYTAGVICRDEIKALDESCEYFNLALDDNHGDLLKAFEAVDRILTNKKDWKNLERNYRRMVKRLKPGENNQLMVMLLANLGEIYRTRLRDFTAAIETFKLASQLDPDNMQRHEILAELYEHAGPEHLPSAVEHHQVLIAASPYKFDSYHKLYSIYMETRQYDKAWCVASALSFLKKADPEERQLYEQYKQKGFVRAKQRMSDDLWVKNVYAKNENRLLSILFGILAHPVARLKAKPYKQWGIKRKDQRDIATDQLLFSKVFNYVSQVLNLTELPELFLRPEQRGGIQIANAVEKNQLIPFCVVGADLLQGRPEKELAYTIAKELSFLRPEHFVLKSVQTVAELKVLLFSSMKMVNPNVKVPGDVTAAVDQTVGQLARLIPPGSVEQLGQVVNKLAQSEGGTDLSQWLQAVEYSGNHTGFVLCNDLEVAAAIVSREPVPVGGMPAKEKIKELVLYAISEDYFEVRNALGMSIAG